MKSPNFIYLHVLKKEVEWTFDKLLLSTADLGEYPVCLICLISECYLARGTDRNELPNEPSISKQIHFNVLLPSYFN